MAAAQGAPPMLATTAKPSWDVTVGKEAMKTAMETTLFQDMSTDVPPVPRFRFAAKPYVRTSGTTLNLVLQGEDQKNQIVKQSDIDAAINSFVPNVLGG